MLDSLKAQVKSYKLVSQDEKGIIYEVAYSSNKEIGDFFIGHRNIGRICQYKAYFW